MFKLYRYTAERNEIRRGVQGTEKAILYNIAAELGTQVSQSTCLRVIDAMVNYSIGLER